ncbi:hypothetical protein ONS95_005516 [Cadophora gregata]|uniref:uncharacterized protein n=1 Tax=Cadophora gregata TaxID=51156 RepID=UPI0026DC7407|nr:uncharacterized protein ONS95_005516 [Cadophora gregata]KAK0103495.1 hypothetical protein ONS95_005516 [Cadophora gregata]
MAGTVHKLGENVNEFEIGDRVAAFHPMFTPGGTYAEYALAPKYTVFKILDEMIFEEAATIPLVITTAALSLFEIQGLPAPWSPPSTPLPPTPLIIYGASSSLGSFAVKLAIASNIHPIISIHGVTIPSIAPLLDSSKGDTLISYLPSTNTMQSAVRTVLGPLRAFHAIDCISDSKSKSWIPISQLLSPGGIISVVSGANSYTEAEIPEGVVVRYTYVGAVHEWRYKEGMPKQPDEKIVSGMKDFAGELFEWLGKGEIRGHPWKVVDGGLRGVEEGLRLLKGGGSGGKKFVYRVGETEGLEG